MNYLNSGGSVYLEGTDIGYNNSTTSLWPMLGITYLADGSPFATGNVQTLTGENMASGLTFGYPYKTVPDNYVDEFGAGAGELALVCQSAKGRVGYYSGPTGTYRTITSAVIFGAIEDGSNTKAELLGLYMEYLTGGTGIGESGTGAVENSLLTFQNPSIGDLSALLELSVTACCDLGVYDMSGRRVGVLADGEMNPGAHMLMLQEGLSTGTYLISGRIGDNPVSERVVLLK